MRPRIHLVSLVVAALSTVGAAHAADKKATCTAAYADAQSLRDAHKLRDAREKLHTCSDPQCSPFIVKDCTAWLVDLEARVPSVVLSAKDARGQALGDTTVIMDGQPFLSSLDGNAVEVDPGAHTFAFVASDGTRVEQQATVLEGQKAQAIGVTIPTPASVAALKESKPPEVKGVPLPFWTTRREVAIAGAGAGVVSIVVGSVFGILTASAISDQKSDCASPSSCPRLTQANSEHSTWTTDSAVSTATFIAGGVLIAAGAAVFFTAPKSETKPSPAVSFRVVPSATPGGGALLLQGAF
jgi:hypothetical protein